MVVGGFVLLVLVVAVHDRPSQVAPAARLTRPLEEVHLLHALGAGVEDPPVARERVEGDGLGVAQPEQVHVQEGPRPREVARILLHRPEHRPRLVAEPVDAPFEPPVADPFRGVRHLPHQRLGLVDRPGDPVGRELVDALEPLLLHRVDAEGEHLRRAGDKPEDQGRQRTLPEAREPGDKDARAGQPRREELARHRGRPAADREDTDDRPSRTMR